MRTEVEPKKASFVKLEEYHQPTLADGDYEITIKQKVKIDKHVDIGEFSVTRHFTVAGERFELKPTDVESVFPPDGNLGDHSNVLPHVILNRSTLPWERTVNGQQGTTGIPWMALLLFDEEQTPKPQTLTARELLSQAKAGKPQFPEIKLEIAQHLDDLLTVIDVPKALLEAMMPAVEELKLLTHVRFGTCADDTVFGDELAIIIANRLPQGNKTSTAHLVSLEKRFKKVAGAEEYRFDYGKAESNDLVRLVSLKSWSFACESDDKNFKELLRGLNTVPSTLRLPGGTSPEQKLFDNGYVVVPHYFREGDQTISWFRGPLIPGGEKESPKFELPARTADELVRYDTKLSMFDVSYAAAWELGRLLALQDKDFSTGLYQWKREHAQHVAQTEQRVDHLPFQKPTRVFLPEGISAWFRSLRQLEGIPFNYLVPDERMLPAESIRFFRVDPSWVNCLADGAFSIGRVASSDHEADKSHGERSPAAGLVWKLTGFLLRSEVVSGWPGLLVDGFPEGKDKPGDALRVLRMERLSEGVLLCLFAGEVARVDFYLKPETLHFGLTVEKAGGFSKSLRDRNGKARAGDPVTIGATHWRSDSPRTMNVVAVAESIAGEVSPSSPLTSAEFGLQMVESGEKVFIVRKS